MSEIWSHSDEIKLSYYRLLSREGGLTNEMREERRQLEDKFTRMTREVFPGTVKGRVEAIGMEDEYSIHYKKREEEYNREVNFNACELGRLGGQAKSEAKTMSSRENGKKGGRPRSRESQLDMEDI